MSFRITQELNGALQVLQNGQETQSIVSSVLSTNINVQFHDPSHFLRDATIHYFWFINTVNYGETLTVGGEISLTFRFIKVALSNLSQF